jgi:hypothetical protein
MLVDKTAAIERMEMGGWHFMDEGIVAGYEIAWCLRSHHCPGHVEENGHKLVVKL